MLIPDQETELDFLNGEAISNTIALLLTNNRQHPLTVGIHGAWGAGKTTILKMLAAKLREDDNITVLWFNGWTFEGFDDAKMVLIETTISELAQRRTGINQVKSVATKLLRRVNWLKLLKRSSGLAWNVITGLPSFDQVGSAIELLGGHPDGVSEGDQRNQSDNSLLRSAEPDTLPNTLSSFRKEFKELLDTTNTDQLVVLIDDLDRCLPATAIQTLEAIKLFLSVPKTAFIIGADESMIEYAVRQHFPDTAVTSGPLSYSRNYLEKLVQVPFHIPALGRQETRIYVTLLLVQILVGDDHDGFRRLLRQARALLATPWIEGSLSQEAVKAVDERRGEDLDQAFILAQQIAPVLAEGAKGNPRQIKRFLNTLLLRQEIASARGFGDLIAQPVLGKLMLAERFQPDFYGHVASQIMGDRQGHAADIKALEGAIETTGDQRQRSVTERRSRNTRDMEPSDIERWQQNDWIKRWLRIQPAMGDVDLRPYVFVAHDDAILGGGAGLGRLDDLFERLCGGRMAVSGAHKEVKSLSPADAGILFDRVRERVLSAGTFRAQPSGIDGLGVLAKYHTRLQLEVVSLLQTLTPSTLGPWAVGGWTDYITEPRAQNALRDLIKSWSDQNENTVLKNAAKLTARASQGAL